MPGTNRTTVPRYIRLSGRTYDLSTDGRRFLLVKRSANQVGAPQIVVVQNWFEELKRLAPATR